MDLVGAGAGAGRVSLALVVGLIATEVVADMVSVGMVVGLVGMVSVVMAKRGGTGCRPLAAMSQAA